MSDNGYKVYASEQFVEDKLNGLDTGGVQPDWNQNDETASDYIKNRTHYDSRVYTEVGENLEYTFDGILEGKETIERPWDDVSSAYWVKVSDIPPTSIENLIGADITLNNGGEQVVDKIPEDGIVEQIDNIIYLLYDGIVVAMEDGNTEGLTFTKGVWFLYVNDSSYFSSLTQQMTVNIEGELKTLDEEFIPDTIARVSNLPQSDWNQNDETASDYIKNKPFGIEVEDVEHIPEVTADFNSQLDNGSYTSYSVPELDTSKIFVEGETYTVVWDGVRYENLIASISKDGVTPITAIGSVDKTFNDYPFFLGVVEEQGYATYWVYSNNSGTHTFAVYKSNKNIKMIDEEFIPDTIARTEYVDEFIATHKHSWNDLEDRPFGEEISYDAILCETSLDLGASGQSSDFSQNSPLVLGETYQVIIDGVEYEPTVCKEYKSMYATYNALGNTSLHNPSYGEDTGENYLWIDNFAIYVSDKPNQTVFVKLLGRGNTIVQLDEKYIPDTIARKTDIPETAQPDWNQNDETASDYIKNKPFYGKEDEEILTWDGNIEGLEDTSNNFYWVSPIIVDESILDKYYFKLVSESEYSNCMENMNPVEDFYVGSYFAFVFKDNSSGYFMNTTFTFPKAGIYLHSLNGNSVYVNSIIIKGETKQLDEKYIPDTIARISYVDEQIAAEASARGTAITNAINNEVSARNTAIATAKTEANDYTDDQISAEEKARDSAIATAVSNEATARDSAIATAKTEANEYADTHDTTTLNSAKSYTDSKISNEITSRNSAIATAKTEANEYTDASVSKNTSDLTAHTNNTDIHVTAEEKAKWNSTSQSSASEFTELILKSSTEGSNKKFKITIDDDGNLKVTEIPSIETLLMDFEYADNGDGTYTITDWKGTLNGEESVDFVVPDDERVII